MVTVIRVERKSAVLTPSTLACLSRMPTVNMTAGFAHGCVYCYARGFANHPGEGKVLLYSNTLEKIRQELPRKRKKPKAVYFCPASDAFQPIHGKATSFPTAAGARTRTRSAHGGVSSVQPADIGGNGLVAAR